MDPVSTSEWQTATLLQNDEEHDSRNTTPEPRLGVGKKSIVNFRIRLLLFCLIETGFIALASVCLARPLSLTFGLSDSKVKGGLTVISIVWHSLAAFVGGKITIDAFSREWSVQSEQIAPGTTDRVSTIDSGLLERTSHCLSKHASSTFRLAFLASLSLMVLGQLAPGTMSTTMIAALITVQVGKQISAVNSVNDSGRFSESVTRATLIIKQEKIGLTQFGLKLPANTMMSLPPSNESHRALEYNTDIVEFRHNCRWEAPSFVTEFLLQGKTGLLLNSSSVVRIGQEQNAVSETNSLQPSTGPLASVLLCDAQPQISGGRVRLENNGTVNVISSGQPPDGSFTSAAANAIFVNALQDALGKPEAYVGYNLVNTLAANTFMTSNPDDWQYAEDIAPLDIPSINENMDDLMSSAAKAFIDGYHQLGPTSATFDLVSVPGLGEGQQLTLTTSKELFIITVVLDVIITVLLFALVRSAPTWKRYPFNLANVFRLLSESHTKER